jgi:hypothetical protein
VVLVLAVCYLGRKKLLSYLALKICYTIAIAWKFLMKWIEAKYLYIHPHYGCKLKKLPILILFSTNFGFFITSGISKRLQ